MLPLPFGTLYNDRRSARGERTRRERESDPAMERKTAGERETLVLFSMIQSLWWGMTVGRTYLTTFLKETGVTATQLGIVQAAGGAAGMILLPLIGNACDRSGSVRKYMIPVVCGGVIANALLPVLSKALLPGAQIALLAYAACLISVQALQTSLTDSFCLPYIEVYKIPFSAVRMWGSVGYVFTSATVVAAVSLGAGVSAAFYVAVTLCLPFFLAVRRSVVRCAAEYRPRRGKRAPVGRILKNYYFVVLVVLLLGLDVQPAITFKYLPYVLEHARVDGGFLALFTGFRAFVEMLTMLAANRLIRRGGVRMWHLLAASAFFFALEHLLYPAAYGVFGLLACMIPSGIAAGIQYGVAPNYIYHIAEEDIRYTCQTINGACLALVGIVGTLAGGVVIDRWGIVALLRINLYILLFAGSLFIGLNLLGGRVTEQRNC